MFLEVLLQKSGSGVDDLSGSMENLCRRVHGPVKANHGAEMSDDDSESEDEECLDHCVSF